MSKLTIKDEKQPQFSGKIMRCFYIDGELTSQMRPGTVESDLEQLRLEKRVREANRSNPPSSRPAVSAPARPAPKINPMRVQPPKSPARLALERLYATCFRKKVTLAAGDELAAKVGVEAATKLICEHGPNAAFASAAQQYWADRDVKTAPITYLAPPTEFGGEPSAKVFERRVQATTEPGRVSEAADVGSPAYAANVYQGRGGAR